MTTPHNLNLSETPPLRTDAEFKRMQDDARTGLDLSPGNDTSKYGVETISALDQQVFKLQKENEELRKLNSALVTEAANYRGLLYGCDKHKMWNGLACIGCLEQERDLAKSERQVYKDRIDYTFSKFKHGHNENYSLMIARVSEELSALSLTTMKLRQALESLAPTESDMDLLEDFWICTNCGEKGRVDFFHDLKHRDSCKWSLREKALSTDAGNETLEKLKEVVKAFNELRDNAAFRGTIRCADAYKRADKALQTCKELGLE